MELNTRKWQDKNGDDRYTTEVILQGYNSTLTLLDNRGNTNQSIENKSEDISVEDNSEKSSDSNIDDDIPF